jgi:putative hydrolase of the HAD superfamily
VAESRALRSGGVPGAARPVLEAVLFDAGGTLVRLDYEWIADMLAEYGVIVTAGDVRRAELRGRRQYDLTVRAPRPPGAGEPHPPLGSAGDTAAYFRGMLEGAGVRHPVLDEAIARLFEKQRGPGYLWGRANEGARDTIDTALEMGLRLACVSNSDGRAEAHLLDTGTRDGLEFVVDSQIVGVEKPDPRIFHIALERMGIAPERALYVGDIRGVDEVGARAAGLHFVLVDPSGEYAAPGAPRIPTIADLPEYLVATFRIPALEGRHPE